MLHLLIREIVVHEDMSEDGRNTMVEIHFNFMKQGSRLKVLSEEGYRQALIKAGECLDYEIRSHSMRRGMGKMMLELHPGDIIAKSVLMELYNHSSEKVTNKLRDYMLCCFGKILDIKNETNPIVLMKLYNELLGGLETIAQYFLYYKTEKYAIIRRDKSTD